MASRLDRLFVLLESGSSSVTRKAAAQQLGEVQRLQPHELHHLLARVYCHLKSTAWETRIAAGQAIEAILKNVPQWDPTPCENNKETENFESGRLRFDTFDIEKVLAQGAHLMGSEGKEYDMEEDSLSGMDMREKLARQRQLLNARLGLDVVSKLGMDMADLFSNEDLMNQISTPATPTTPSVVSLTITPPKLEYRRPVSELVPSGVQLSSREMNRARRKARQLKGSSLEDGGAVPASGSSTEPDRKRFKPDTTTRADENLPIYGEWTPDVDGSWGPEVQWWPLEGWAGALATELFSSQWETRHGAATALRDMLRCHGKGAGRERGTSKTQMEDMHMGWLEDISLRLLCVLALDRFGDFVTDQMVAPVRETCAQCLGVTASLMGPRGTSKIVTALAMLARQNTWEARHGAHLGLKYLIAVQQELNQDTYAFPSVVQGLWDPIDDVAAAAAAALFGGVQTLVKKLPRTLPAIVSRLRNLLSSQDELAAACGNYMALLAAILAEPETNSILGPRYLASVVPRLWPYLSHPTSSVRKAALQTLRTLTLCPGLLFPVSPTFKDEPKTEPNDSHTDNSSNNLIIVKDVKSCNGSIKTEVKTAEDNAKDESETECKSNRTGVSEEWIRALNSNIVDISNEEPCFWNANMLQEVLRHVFQRVLVEHVNNIQNIAEEVWNNLIKCSNLEMLLHAACPFVSPFMCLTMQPAKISFDPSMLIQSKTSNPERASESLGGDISLCGILSQKWYIGGSETTPLSVREANVTRTRCIAARMLGLLSCYVIKPAPGIVYTPDTESPINCYVKLLLVYLSSKSALQRMVVGLVVSSWAQQDKSIRPAPSELVNKLHECLIQPIYFDEIAVACTRILQEARDFIALMKHYKICVDDDGYSNIISLEQVIQFMGQHCHDLLNTTKLKKNKVVQSLEDRRKNILSSAVQCSNEQGTLSLATLAALAGAVANLNALPEKLNPVIKPLMDSIKKEENEHLQLISAENLAEVLRLCVDRQPCPNPKVLNNLCNFLRSDPEFTPRVVPQSDTVSNGDAASDESGVENKSKPKVDNMYHGILTLALQRRQAERAVFRRANSTASTSGTSRGPGRPPASDIPLEELFPVENDVQKQCRVQRRGATMALTSLAKHFGIDLIEKLPKLWEILIAPLTGVTVNMNENDPLPQVEDIITNLQVLEVVAPAIDKSILPKIMQHLEGLTSLLENPYMAIRHMASRCLAVLASIDPPSVMQVVVNMIIPMLGSVENDRRRLSVQGAAEALTCIVDRLQINVVPYIVLLVVPLLGRMSDHDEDVRLMSTHCFATLIQLMPLEGAIKEPVPLSVPLAEQRNRDRSFLEQLFNPKSIGDYVVPIPINAELRSYQQAGINWLAFLNRYKLHGVLCDDMGLGKTLQSICMVAGDHYQRHIKYKETKAPDCAPLPSLVVCPPTLTGHWVYEVKKFMSIKYLNPLHYTGPPFERERLRSRVKHHNMVVASYDIVRKDIDFFSGIKWNYCILDEGHIIKNGKTKASKAIKTLIANHRLILSGTPIQNNVLELWSLFDFLMPGLLGTERQFTARYSRPILAARDPKATPQHQEAGALAMEALHRQVLPFLLRRMKEDVLTELPPKITQDYYCDLSPLQKRLYEDFSKTHMPNGLPEGKHHVFQALRYLQNVCNHPKLVLTPQHPEYPSITQELSRMNSNLNDIQHSAKLTALKQLLQDCGIGCPSSETSGVLSQHRALVFCQLKVMLDVLEKDLLQPMLPNVSYLRLDGSVAPGQRQQLVQRFNNDPSIDILLLTTQVGGLGLNLTGADTVIFVEHDWNPMKDLQAMDRAHRIGQKKVVNVYRLITKSTLEEKIMCLQKFKLLTANTVISGENASLETMGTDQLLDLFHLDGDGKKNSTLNPGTSQQFSGPTTVKTILENLPELWDDQQYENEYDMTQFVKSLKKKN